VITLDESLLDCQAATNDTTATSQANFLTWLNQGYQNLIATFGRPGIEKITNTTTNLLVPGTTLVDANRSYQAPPDFLFMKTIKIMIGNRWYQLTEEESTEMWNYRTEYAYGGIPSEFYINENFGVGSAEIQIDPICTVTSVVAGSSLTPTSATIVAGVLTLNFSSLPPWTAGQNITVGGFTTQSGININQAYLVATAGSNYITIALTSETGNDTVTTIGTVATTIGVPMQMVYESSDVRLDHLGINPQTTPPTTANVTFTYGNNVVTSNAAIFQPWMSLGSTYITPGDDGDGNWYKIVNFNNTSQVTIGNYYQNTTVVSSANWSINQIMSLHVDMQDIPQDWALWKYYKAKKDAKWRDYYQASYNARLNAAKGNWATKSRSSIIRSKSGMNRWHPYPGWFPAMGVSS
jgi:hypothetical protein